MHARPSRTRLVVAAGIAGAVLLGVHVWMVYVPERERWLTPFFAAVGTLSLYAGYALITPVLVMGIGRPMSRAVGRLFGLPGGLAEEPFARAPWRSTGACWVLMVGLSLIVHLAIRTRLVQRIWDFPAKLPEAFVWSPNPVPGDVIDKVARIPGVAELTVTTDVTCRVTPIKGASAKERLSLVERFLNRLTRPVFVAGEPDRLLGMMKLAFVEGDEAEALEKVRRGGYVVIPVQTARHHHLSVGDKVRVTIGRRSSVFEVAGVVASPAMDLAVTAFHAESYMQFAAASAMLGTRRDLREKFGIDLVSMVMCNVTIPDVEPPADFHVDAVDRLSDDRALGKAILQWSPFLPNERAAIDAVAPALRRWLAEETPGPPPGEVAPILHRFARALRWVRWMGDGNATSEEAWALFQERLVLERIAQAMNRPDAVIGSLRRLKQRVLDSLEQAGAIVTWLPAVLLVIASIGVGNLVRVSVHVRTRQIGMLRAVGALREQILRLILTEAITIGGIGSVVGLALGIHLSASVFAIAQRLLGLVLPIEVPAGTTALAVGLTITVCLLAGIPPARRAARSDVLAALQTT
ncbi:MAG: ABC transporter permease [Planctomycetota bacterium]|nr:MAG: ABC transporter permease [Planctomycetota bacterium]